MPSLTDTRKAVHDRYTDLLEARPGTILTPALDLGKSLRSLNGGQLAVLDHLLAVFADHPQTHDEHRLLTHLATRLGA